MYSASQRQLILQGKSPVTGEPISGDEFLDYVEAIETLDSPLTPDEERQYQSTMHVYDDILLNAIGDANIQAMIASHR